MTPYLESRLVNGVCRVIWKKPIPVLGTATFRQQAPGMELAEEGETAEKHV